MTPRNEDSQSWTPVPEDFKQQVLQIFNKHFANKTKNGEFIVDGRIYKKEILMRCGYIEKNSIKPVHFDMSLDYKAGERDPLNYFEQLVDLGASLLETYFQDPNEDFPYQWLGIDFNGTKIFVKLDRTNTELEKQANQILNDENTDDALIKDGNLESDEIEKIIDTLNKKEDPSKH